MDVVAETTKKIIQHKGLKQKAIAELAGYTQKQLSDLLCGRKIMKSTDIFKISSVLGVTPNELFAIEDFVKVG